MSFIVKMEQTLENYLSLILDWIFSKGFFGSILIIILTVVILRIMKEALNRSRKLLNKTGVKDTSSGIIYDCLRVGLILIAIIVILQLNDVNVTSLIAGLGVVSVVGGLALQDTMKDIIMGVHIVVDHFYSVGDSVKIGDYEGKIVEFNLRTTKLKNYEDDTFVILCNRDISHVTHCSKWFNLDIGLSYDDDVDKINAVLTQVAEKITAISGVEKCLYLGTQNFDDSSIAYRLRVFSTPDKKYTLRRAAVQLLQRELNANGLSIPFNQLDIHQFPVRQS